MPTVYKVEKCSCHLLKSHKMNPLISSVDRLKSDCSSCMHNIWWTRCLRTCCRCPLFITVATSYFKRSFLLIRYRFLSEIQCWTTKWCSAEVFILTGPENKNCCWTSTGQSFCLLWQTSVPKTKECLTSSKLEVGLIVCLDEEVLAIDFWKRMC